MQVMLVWQEQLYLLPCSIQRSDFIPFFVLFPMNFTDINYSYFVVIWS